MKFDSNQAWKQAAGQVSANRDVLIALSGVFFLLPGLAIEMFLPQPQPQANMTAQQIMDLTRGYYFSALPYIVPTLLLQAAGTLAMLTLFTDRDRPTVGESIRRGVIGLFPYIAAQLLLGIGMGLVAAAIFSAAALTGLLAVIVVLGTAVVVAAIYVAVRTSLVAPVVAVEGVRNPVAAMIRSWRLTKGNSVRIALFYLLIVLAFAVVISIAMLLVGIVVALVASGPTALFIASLFRSILAAVMTVYFVAILAAVHRQLAGPSIEREQATFQ